MCGCDMTFVFKMHDSENRYNGACCYAETYTDTRYIIVYIHTNTPTHTHIHTWKK